MGSHDRLASMEEGHCLAAMALMVYGLPQVPERVDALALIPGENEEWRVAGGYKLWNRYPSLEYLIIAGEPTYDAVAAFRLYKPRRPERIVTYANAAHTLEQAQQVISKVKELGLTSLAITASPYHVLRAYLTILKQSLKAGVQIPMIVVPTEVAPARANSESGLNSWELLPAELDRITRYQKQGDVASFIELQQYLDWMWESGFFD